MREFRKLVHPLANHPLVRHTVTAAVHKGLYACGEVFEKTSDRAVLAAHCEAWSRLVAAVAQYRAEGLTKVNPDRSVGQASGGCGGGGGGRCSWRSSAGCLACRRSPSAGSDRSHRPTTATTVRRELTSAAAARSALRKRPAATVSAITTVDKTGRCSAK